jgi:hypothetical protein
MWARVRPFHDIKVWGGRFNKYWKKSCSREILVTITNVWSSLKDCVTCQENDIVCHPRATLSYTSGILPKSETNNSKFKKKWFWMFSVARSEGKKSKVSQMNIYLILSCSQKYRWLKFFILFLVYSQVWLIFPGMLATLATNRNS